MTWSNYRGLGAAPEANITPTVDTAQLVLALRRCPPPERPDDDDDDDFLTRVLAVFGL
jgi:hypothetical protein